MKLDSMGQKASTAETDMDECDVPSDPDDGEVGVYAEARFVGVDTCLRTPSCLEEGVCVAEDRAKPESEETDQVNSV